MNNYKVTKEVRDKLVEWRDTLNLDAVRDESYISVSISDLAELPQVVLNWWLAGGNPIERNNRLVAIVSWLNGKVAFEVYTPEFIVRSDKPNNDGDYTYVIAKGGVTAYSYSSLNATKFDTPEKAMEWANSHQVVIEVGSEG